MTDDDFDKVEDDEFTGEFDFVAEDNAPVAPNNGNNKPSGGLIKGLVLLAILGGGGYYAYTTYFAAPDVPAPQNPQTTNLPTPLPEPIPEQVPAPAPDNAPVDFSETISPSDQPKDQQLDDAVPQMKNFTEVQRELKSAASSSRNKSGVPDEINATLDSISEEMTLNVNQMKQLESTIANLSSTLDQINKSISAMDNRVLSLTETVDSLAQDLTNVKKIMVDEDIDLTSPNTLKMSPKGRAPKINTNNDYTVHAIIPGRAWLKSADGQIITVTEGDKVGDYGTVAVIDAANGLVRTSSGITFR